MRNELVHKKPAIVQCSYKVSPVFQMSLYTSGLALCDWDVKHEIHLPTKKVIMEMQSCNSVAQFQNCVLMLDLDFNSQVFSETLFFLLMVMIYDNI